ncbi:MAG: SufD family Fe-S cluster assembly protein, partial [Candidatus Cybelea sp.]
ISNRSARPGRDSRIAWCLAELGADLAAGDVRVSIEKPGAQAHLTALFFPRAAQHVDLVSTVEHLAGEATSETLVKSAASEHGQARFLGNIRIARQAQGSDARLRDDALLLSQTAHVDSVPALEIAANDVKAYHGATVGAIDAEQIFYMESRGIERSAAERLIALGFFEPAIEHFPSSSLRDEIRTALAEKLS